MALHDQRTLHILIPNLQRASSAIPPSIHNDCASGGKQNLRCFLEYHQTLSETTPESQLLEVQAAETLHPTLHKELNPERCLRDPVNGHHRSGSGLSENFEAKAAQKAVS